MSYVCVRSNPTDMVKQHNSRTILTIRANHTMEGQRASGKHLANYNRIHLLSSSSISGGSLCEMTITELCLTMYDCFTITIL